MGKDRPRYLVFINGRWRWHPSKKMRAAGFHLVNLSKGTCVDGRPEPLLEDKAEALRLNEDWDRYRRGLPPEAVEENSYPVGSIGEAYLRIMRFREQERRAKGVVWSKEQ